MKKILAAFIIATLFINCTKKETEITKIQVPDSLISEEKTNFNIEKIPDNCYLQVVGKDSTFIHITDNLGTFSGVMSIKNAEKDSSKGELSGFKNGDTLKLSYIFESEGVISERPIYYLQKAGNLIEGFGDYEQIKSLKFEDKNAFKAVNCKSIEKQLK